MKRFNKENIDYNNNQGFALRGKNEFLIMGVAVWALFFGLLSYLVSIG